jgi:hypothetical protein
MTYDTAVLIYCALVAGLALAMVAAIAWMLWDQRGR